MLSRHSEREEIFRDIQCQSLCYQSMPLADEKSEQEQRRCTFAKATDFIAARLGQASRLRGNSNNYNNFYYNYNNYYYNYNNNSRAFDARAGTLLKSRYILRRCVPNCSSNY